MTARSPYFTTVSGRQIDLVHPRVEDVDFDDVAHHIAQVRRYGGAARRPYSVAEHLLKGLEIVQPGARDYWLAHDAHEYCSQDDTTPKKKALPLVMAEILGPDFPLADLARYAHAIKEAHAVFEWRHMEAVHRAAGLEWPVPVRIEEEVKRVDRVMLVTEWEVLMAGDLPEEYRWPDIDPVPNLIGAAEMSFFVGKTQFKNACRELLPCFQKVAA